MDFAKFHDTRARERAPLAQTRARASNVDDMATLRGNEEQASRASISAEMESWRSRFSSYDVGMRKLMSSAISSFRCLSWGTPMPMTVSEDRVHKAFAEGADMPWPPVTTEWRPIYVISKVQIDSAMTVAALLVHPATSTADCEVPRYSKIARTGRVNPGIETLAHPSSGESRTSATPSADGKVKGRYAMRAIDLSIPGSHEEEHARTWSPSFVSLSHSSLIFVISKHGKSWTCLPSSATLDQILRLHSPEFSIHENLNRIMVKPNSALASSESHAKLSNTGSCTFVGSPRHMGSVSKATVAMIRALMETRCSVVRLVSGLAIVAECGTDVTEQ